MARTSRKVQNQTPEDRENELIALATSLAEKQLKDGSASAQVITHYLKLASARENLEREKLKKENDLLRAKYDAIQSQQRLEELYTEAINAMREYSGHNEDNDD